MRKIIFVLLLTALLGGCASASDPTAAPTKPTKNQGATNPTVISNSDTIDTEMIYSKAQLLGEAESLEEAEELAELYGITLVDYKNGLARFYTEEDPREVILRGRDNDWPKLVLNRVNNLY